MTDNELIARFMGGVRQKCTSYSIHDYPNELPKFILKDLKYHKSFDWLMPVAMKINKLKPRHDFFAHICIKNIEIDSLYKAVVEFIKWYNQQQNDSPSS